MKADLRTTLRVLDESLVKFSVRARLLLLDIDNKTYLEEAETMFAEVL